MFKLVELSLNFDRLVDYYDYWAYVFVGTLTENGKPLAGKEVVPKVDPMTSDVLLPTEPTMTNVEGRFAHIPFFKKSAAGKTFKTWVTAKDYGLDSRAFYLVVGQPPAEQPPAEIPLVPMALGAAVGGIIGYVAKPGALGTLVGAGLGAAAGYALSTLGLGQGVSLGKAPSLVSREPIFVGGIAAERAPPPPRISGALAST
jgi:hypothetical protein